MFIQNVLGKGKFRIPNSVGFALAPITGRKYNNSAKLRCKLFDISNLSVNEV
jgi:hypothetical protein